MQAILKGEKRFCDNREIRRVEVPNYPELSIDKLYGYLSHDNELMLHLPDVDEKKKPDRDFIWHVVYHLRPNFVRQVVTDARR